ncbi:hypothetical protein D8674_038167 [Pyrus ussuriensis x Pyrus communis]|uniref:GRIP domain-containing protein RUD3-like n=1 Tax=Pyrus ussuriensis x Pyrus communis TaxID=2448454 RepID=A0A5N5I4G6_9ROSA|nr:hypothetical protein D8674_038167 [Pyrus ussuriensis x Pyrus communis]
MIWDTLAFNLNDMRYSCFDSAWLWRMEVDIYRNCPNNEYSRDSDSGASSISKQAILLGIWFSRFRDAFSDVKKGWAFLQVCFATEHGVMQGNTILSGQEQTNVEKVLRVPKKDRHLGYQPLVSECQRRAMEKVSKKGGTSTNKGKAPMLVPVDDILFHKGARKHRVRPAPRPKSQEEVLKITASKRAEAEAIRCAAAIVAREERRLLPLLPTIGLIFPPTIESTDQEGGPSFSRKRKYKEEVGSILWKDLKVAMQPSSFRYINNFLAGRRSTVDELGKPLDENESDHDQMMRLSSYVMTKYDDRLREVERYKAKFKENYQLVNDAIKTSKALAEAICLKDQHFESLKRRNGENVRLKKQLEGTGKQLETTILEVSKVKGELESALVEVSELKRSIPTERDTAVQQFLGSQAFHDAFKPHCIRAANFEKMKWMAILERYDNGSIIRKYRKAFILAIDPSSEDDSNNEASVGEQSQESGDGFGDTEDGGNGNAVETQSDIVRGSASDEDDSYVSLLVIVLQVISVPWMAKGLAIGFWTRNIACSSSTGTTASVPKTSENRVSPIEVRHEVRNAKSAKDVLLYKVFYFCLNNGCQRFYFGPLCKIVNCNDCIVDLPFLTGIGPIKSSPYWAKGQGLIIGVRGSGGEIISASACVRHRKYGRLKPCL